MEHRQGAQVRSIELDPVGAYVAAGRYRTIPIVYRSISDHAFRCHARATTSMPGDTCDVAASLVVPTMTDQYGAAMVRTWPRYSNVVDRDRARRAGKRARTCEQDCMANREALLLRLRCYALATVPGGGRQVQAREWAPARTEPTKALGLIRKQALELTAGKVA